MWSKLLSIEFYHPWFLLLFLAIPVLIWWIRYGNKNNRVFMPLPSIEGLEDLKANWKVLFYNLVPYLKLLALMLFIIALARPRLSLKQESVKAEGIDIMMAIDVSTSMLAMDFDPNRLEASKAVAVDFIENREYDRIGMVIFSGEAFTFSPVTTDHELLIDEIERIKAGTLKDGTAIGNGLAASVNRLKDSKSKSKIIILLTDGVNNSGYIDPSVALELAKKYNIKVYTIGVGSNGYAKMPFNSFGRVIYRNSRVEIDERLLNEIANETGGKYFRAENLEELQRIYDLIDKMEKTKIEVRVFKRYSEEYRLFLIPGLLLLLLIFLLKKTVLKTLV